MSKVVLYNETAQNKIRDGVNAVADAVKITLGPKGRNVILDKGYGAPLVTNDGVSIAREIDLKDRFESMGAEIVKEVASKANEVSGDGTTTATILVQSLINEGMKLVAAGAEPMALRRGLEKSVNVVTEELFKQSRKIESTEEIAQVATISAQDSEIGQTIAEAMEEIGKDGIITVEESQTFGITKEVVTGLTVDRGYVSPMMVTDPNRAEAVYENPSILVTDEPILAIADVLPILEALAKDGVKNVVLFADDFGTEPLSTFILNKVRGTFNVLAIKAPGYAERKSELLQDIAIAVGATFISSTTGIKLSEATVDMLGSAKKIISKKDTTAIVAGAGAPESLKTRITTLKNEIEASTSEYDKERLKSRVAHLSGGVAVLKVGAATESELKEKKLRIEDAIQATKAAVEEGIVPGGGIALVRASKALDQVELEDEEMVAVKILRTALQAPIRQIAKNAGKDGAEVLFKIGEQEPSFGWDAKHNTYVDMFENGIIDPTKVTRVALQSAVSAAALLLTTDAMVVEDLDERLRQKALLHAQD